MLAAVKDANLAPCESAGEDKGIPVTGSCTYATYPVYIAPAGTEALTLNPIARAAEKMHSLLPFHAKSAHNTYLTPAPDLGSWKEISAENMPGLCTKVMVVGQFAIWVDLQYPGGSNTFADYTPYHLLADLLLRCDTRHDVFEDAIKAGCCYIQAGNTQSTHSAPFAIVTRAESAVEFNITNYTWNLANPLPEPSVLNNPSQHHSFAILAKDGRYELSGEQVAKLVLSCEDAINKLAQVYSDNLENFLSLTRFKLRHPIDTVGAFMRESASVAMVSTIPSTIPTKYYFPVWLHDTIMNRYYRISVGFTRVSADTLPPNTKVAGTLCGVYEVIYDADAKDFYTSRQLAWLASVVMQSQYIPVNDAVTAMRGCMESIDSIFASLYTPEVVTELEPAPDTRIVDLTSDVAWANQGEATVAICHGKTLAYRYSSVDSKVITCKCWPNRDMDISASISIGGSTLVPRMLATMLVALSESDMLYGWENVIAHDDNLPELVEPPAACVEFYSKVPHVYDPPICTYAAPLYLKYDEKIYSLSYVNDHLCWGEADAIPEEAQLAGTFFGGQLFYVNGMDAMYSSQEFTDLMRSTLSMFGDFSRAPTVYKYLYTVSGDDTTWSRIGEPDTESSYYLAYRRVEKVLCYNAKSNIWSLSNQQLSGVTCIDGEFGLLVPDGVTSISKDTAATMLKSLQACMLGLAKATPDVTVPGILRSPRGVSVTCENATFSVEYEGQSYTVVDGRLKLCSPVDGDLTPEQLLQLLTEWVSVMIHFNNSAGAYAELSTWGFDFTRKPALPPEQDIGAFAYFNSKYYADILGLNRSVPPDFSFPPKNTAPESIGVEVFLAGDGYGAISTEMLARLCASYTAINAIVAHAARDCILCQEDEQAAKTWYTSRPAGRAEQRRKTTTMYELATKPLIAVVFPDGRVTGWDAGTWGRTTVDGLTSVGNGVYYDADRMFTFTSIETARDIIERVYMLMFTPTDGTYKYLRALKLMR